MGSVAGQTLTGRFNRDPYYFAARCSAVGATLVDGSRLICKAGGVAWFVAPDSTQISLAWANGQYNSTSVGPKCCISEWGILGTCLSARVCCYVATQWFVPSTSQLSNPGFNCRGNWPAPANIWSSNEFGSAPTGCADNVCLNITFRVYFAGKGNGNNVRAFRCVTY